MPSRICSASKFPQKLGRVLTLELGLDLLDQPGAGILQQVELVRELGLSHLYLGYWVRDAEKMRYKTDYRPTELFVNGRWVRIT